MKSTPAYLLLRSYRGQLMHGIVVCVVCRNIKTEGQDAEDDISCVLFNSLFRLVLLISTFGIVKGYHIDVLSLDSYASLLYSLFIVFL